jgi:hypothetical protein
MKFGKSRKFVLLLAMVATAGLSSAQLVTSNLTAVTASDVAATLVGPGVSINNIAYMGSDISAGLFWGGSGIIGFEQGIILSSGNVGLVPGPNISTGAGAVLNTVGDADLNLLSGQTTYDATILEFDFVPNGDHIYFRYVFSSEEYNEYVYSSFNDVFAFFVNGTNCAVVGDPPVPVSVNTINNGYLNNGVNASNSALFINNDTGLLNTEMDGLTVVLTCDSPVVPNATNHMKLAIADASDRILDSNVFIEFESFTTVDPGEYVCPMSQGYWKNHMASWPASDLYLGDWEYGAPALLALLQAPVKGDASISLSKQLIAAKLNIANGSDPGPVEDAIDEADALIGASTLPAGVRSKTSRGNDMNQVKDILDDYNNGLMTTNCATLDSVMIY